MSVSPKEESYETMLLMYTAFSIVEEHNNTLVMSCAEKAQSSSTALWNMVELQNAVYDLPGIRVGNRLMHELSKTHSECMRLSEVSQTDTMCSIGMKKNTNSIQLALLLSTKQLDSKESRI